MLASLSALASAIVVPTPLAPAAQAAYPLSQAAYPLLPVAHASSVIFPSELLAVGPPKDVQQVEYTEEEKAAARNTGLLVLFFGAAPSFWAQNELVWNKDKLADARAKTKKSRKKKR